MLSRVDDPWANANHVVSSASATENCKVLTITQPLEPYSVFTPPTPKLRPKPSTYLFVPQQIWPYVWNITPHHFVLNSVFYLSRAPRKIPRYCFRDLGPVFTPTQLVCLYSCRERHALPSRTSSLANTPYTFTSMFTVVHSRSVPPPLSSLSLPLQEGKWVQTTFGSIPN